MSDYKVIGTYIEKEMYMSKAFRSLTGAAHELLIYFLGKRFIKTIKVKKKKTRICVNCNNIVFTYIEAKEKYGLTEKRFLKARDQLLARGFITIKNPGGCFKKDKAVYAISDQWCLWQPGIVFTERKKVTVQKGFLNSAVATAKTKKTKASK